MQVDPTTQPLPPMGQTTMPTPLSVEGIMSHNIEPDNLVTQSIPAMTQNNSLYYGKYSIDRDQPTGAKFFEYNLEYPLGVTDNLYYQQPDNLGNFRMNLTWALLPVYFSRSCKVDFIQVHQPIKVSDCCVSFDVISRYSGKANTNYNTDAFANDTQQAMFDDTDDHFTSLVPSYWATSCVPTRYTRYLNNYQPAFIPKTVQSFFIRSPYVNNALQPDSFDVLVYLIPIISLSSTMVSPTRVTRTIPTIDNFIPLPYVFNRQQV
jgi:hypothetical protein